MKNVTVTLLAKKPSELGRFLNTYFQKDIIYQEGAFGWSCFYNTPAETIGIISTLIDNSEKYNIEVILNLNKVGMIKVTEKNIESIIKLFLFLESYEIE